MRSSTRTGLTLVEAITAMVIIAAAAPALLIALSTASGNRTDALFASRARWLAAERLEDVVADLHSPTRGYSWITSANYAAEMSLEGLPGFSRTTEVTEVSADLSTPQPGSGIKLVTVTITMSDQRGVSRTQAISTVLTAESAMAMLSGGAALARAER